MNKANENNRPGGEEFEAISAGLEPSELNPLVIKVLQEIGIGISGKSTQGAFDLYKS